jgi:NAD(P)-dependent dehydrogenase (short-subunit alcohol dehydrogenase family)
MLPGIKLFDLTGRTAIVTGGSKGLGLAMAASLASAGCNIMLVNRNENEGISAANQLEKEYKIQTNNK